MDIADQLHKAKQATSTARSLTTKQKHDLIFAIAESIEKNKDDILQINSDEVLAAKQNGIESSACDRLMLDSERIKAMVSATKAVADLQDPVGEVLESWTQPSGISIEKVRVPLGVVAVIYENRPNVTLDSAVIALMSGNVCVLRGSSAARMTNKAIVNAMHQAVTDFGLAKDLITFIDDPSRQGANKLMTSKGFIDVLIPRGGPSLIKAIEENATVPTIIDGAGNCHVYVDKDADLDMAEKIVINSKTQRTSVCNTAESLVVHSSVAPEFIPRIEKALINKNVVLLGDQKSVDLSMGNIALANEQDFADEYLDLKMSVVIVETLYDAINWVNNYSTGHSESIVTDNPESASAFMDGVSSAVVLVNTSTRFTDGQRFGFGAEIGISTQKLHARGPMAFKELTTYQYRVVSDGAIV